MTMMISDASHTPMPQPVDVTVKPHRIAIGVPSCATLTDRRFPLTPEAVAMLVARGYCVKIQADAASVIHYSDSQYLRAGAAIVDRDEALRCDIVLHLAPVSAADVKRMRRGAMLLSLLHAEQQSVDAVRELLNRRIVAVAVDLIQDSKGHTPFYDILAEIDGRAAIALASSLLAHPDHGKGILLGGIAGIVPCEVTIIGSDIAACAAASSALGMGAMVRMFDNDVYRLREASRLLAPGLVTSAIHPRVLENALRTADIVIASQVSPRYHVDSDMVDVMKKGVIVMDLDYDCGAAFPSLPAVDISTLSTSNAALASGGRICYTCPGNAVPRTAAMALSNTFLSLMNDILSCEGVTNVVRMLPGMQRAVYTFLGKPVNRRIAAIVNMRSVDIALLLNCS
ncbi:hypothetical protein [uncultured Muribaculum sp.]|jgi:hypothetical protein|nr:hypothetical protein [uncultured Muribaculum sp.]